jgi:molecular chaperone GrpE
MSDQDQEHTFHVEGVDDDVLNEALKAVEKTEVKGGDKAKLEERIAELEAEVKAKSEEALQFKDKFMRSVADLDNFRKRALKEKEEARHYGAENLLRDLLNTLDNMERAIEATGDVDSIKQGVKMTHDQFKQILRQHGVEVIEAHGTPFDPAHHEAVAHVESAEHPPGTVMQEHRRGYKYRDRLLRASMVSVAKPQATPSDAPSES